MVNRKTKKKKRGLVKKKSRRKKYTKRGGGPAELFIGMGGGGDTLAAFILSSIIFIMGVGESWKTIEKMIDAKNLSWTFDRKQNEITEEAVEKIMKNKTISSIMSSLRIDPKKKMYRKGLNDDDMTFYKRFFKVFPDYIEIEPPKDDKDKKRLDEIGKSDKMRTRTENDMDVKRNPHYNSGWEELEVARQINRNIFLLTVIGGKHQKYGNFEGKFSSEIPSDPRTKGEWTESELWQNIDHIKSGFNAIVKKFKDEKVKTIMIDVGGDIVRKINSESLTELERDDNALFAISDVIKNNDKIDNICYVLGPGCDGHDEVESICKKLFDSGFRRLGKSDSDYESHITNVELTKDEKNIAIPFAILFLSKFQPPDQKARANAIFSQVVWENLSSEEKIAWWKKEKDKEGGESKVNESLISPFDFSTSLTNFETNLYERNKKRANDETSRGLNDANKWYRRYKRMMLARTVWAKKGIVTFKNLPVSKPFVRREGEDQEAEEDYGLLWEGKKN